MSDQPLSTFVDFGVTDQTINVPTRSDGSSFDLLIVPNFATERGRVGQAADSCTALMGLLVDGYEAMDFEDAVFARYSLARTLATSAQASYIVQAEDNGDMAALTPAEIDTVFADKDRPFTADTGAPEWTAAVPLVLIDVDYVPFTDRPAPTGRIVWIRCAEERSMLLSLDEIGMIHFLQRTQSAV